MRPGISQGILLRIPDNLVRETSIPFEPKLDQCILIFLRPTTQVRIPFIHVLSNDLYILQFFSFAVNPFANAEEDRDCYYENNESIISQAIEFFAAQAAVQKLYKLCLSRQDRPFGRLPARIYFNCFPKSFTSSSFENF